MFVFDKLSWDSTFFNRKIGKITLGESIYDSDLRREFLRLKDLGYNLIYIFSEKANQISQQVFTEFDINHVDTKLIYSASIKSISSAVILPTYVGEANLLYNLAFQSGEFSRFKIDQNIGKEHFERLYIEWINNSLYSDFADYIPVYVVDNVIVGFATLKVSRDVGVIGLIAVDNNYRSQGIGKSLMNSIANYLIEHGINNIEVATQLANKPACAFYEKMGFKVKSQTNIYHLWL
jgi:dTDP-4-amino-4,6-dideoxy-D-galactose acyltransferase